LFLFFKKEILLSSLAKISRYPEFAEHGLLWLKQHRYWFAYDPKGPIIASGILGYPSFPPSTQFP
jgi:hypothetical protein